MNKLSYVILNIVFFAPVLIFALIKYWNLIARKWKFILASAIGGIIYFFAVDILAVRWKTWEYIPNKTLGFRLFGAELEEFIWVILVFIMLAIAIEAILEKYYKQKASS